MANDRTTPEENLRRALASAPCFQGLTPLMLEEVATCARRADFESGAFILREGRPAQEFYVIERGRVAIELRSTNRGQIVIQTLEAGDVVGFSWLYPPQRWLFDAQALTGVQTLAIDAPKLLSICDKDPQMGYTVTRRLIEGVVDRLQAMRLQLLDFYGVVG